MGQSENPKDLDKPLLGEKRLNEKGLRKCESES